MSDPLLGVPHKVVLNESEDTPNVEDPNSAKESDSKKEAPTEYAYIIGGTSNPATLLDFDGVRVLEGGTFSNDIERVANCNEITAIILSAPTVESLSSTSRLFKQDETIAVLSNTGPLKDVAQGGSGEVFKMIQDVTSKFLSKMPVFDPKYPAHIIYQCVKKGTLSLYVLAGTKREGEAIAKALSSGKEEDVERVASECGTIAVLMWRPVLADKAVVRVLISGSCSHLRIQESLDKAAKFLPFLNAPIVKSIDVLKDILAPTTARSSIPPVGKPPHASRSIAPVPAARQRIMTAAAVRTSRQGFPKTTVAPARALKAPLSFRAPAKGQKPPLPGKAPVSATTSSSSTQSRPNSAQGNVSAPKQSSVAHPKKSEQAKPWAIVSKKSSNTVIVPKAVLKAQVQKAPVSTAPVSETPVQTVTVLEKVKTEVESTPVKSQRVTSLQQSGNNTIVLSDSPVNNTIVIGDSDDDTVCTLQLGESTAEITVDDDDSKIIKSFSKNLAVVNLDDTEEESETMKPVTIANEPQLESCQTTPHVESDMTKLSGELNNLNIGNQLSEMANVLSQEVISAALPIAIRQRMKDSLQKLDLDESSIEYIQKLSSDLVEEAKQAAVKMVDLKKLSDGLQTLHLSNDTIEMIKDLANIAIEEALKSFTPVEHREAGLKSNTLGIIDDIATEAVNDALKSFTNTACSPNAISSEDQSKQGNESLPDDSKLSGDWSMTSSDQAFVEPNKTVNTPQRSEEQSQGSTPTPDIAKEVLHMPPGRGNPIGLKNGRFARPYYFDLVKVPRGDKTVTDAHLQEFMSKVRSRKIILPADNISEAQLQAVIRGKQTWCEDCHPCTIIPTHGTEILTDFLEKNQKQIATIHLTFETPLKRIEGPQDQIMKISFDKIHSNLSRIIL
ncbi:hypothetical protein L3Y34_014963 [Caenorhabditis briggsae]|uniref:Microtubule-associated protein futsch n=1 Tax=Caenorhabditis briggsae TaxID=6238 RepID=A0AAE9DUS0_CAEBR|nr:hypothetical protein L3Y34_014963 [Caenorhabditis briggsae]